jgi:Secretion system C-terminal sorting domain
MNFKKHILIIFSTIYSYHLSSQFSFDTIKIRANDIAYDIRLDKIYATIPSANGSNGNSIGIINPRSLKLEKTVFMGIEPSVITLSDDGKYVYTGFRSEPIVRRFDISTQTAGLKINLGKSTNGADLYAFALSALPKKSTSFAVSKKDFNISTVTEGIAIYDNDTMRVNTSPQNTNVNTMQFLNDSILYGYDKVTTFSKFALIPTGIVQRNVTSNIPGRTIFGLNFVLNNNRAYFTDGSIIDVSNTLTILGRINRNFAPVVYDTYKNLVCFASTDITGKIIIERYNPETFLLNDVIRTVSVFPNSGVNIGKFITCGNDCYALNYATDIADFNNPPYNHILIVRTLTNPVAALIEEKNKIVIYPNPATESIDIQPITINNTWSTYTISNVNGSIISAGKWYSKEKINIAVLPKGLYFLHLVNSDNDTFYGKFIKK